MEDTRGMMFYHYATFLRKLQPKMFLFENVKGLLTHDQGKTYRTILDIFEDEWYITKYKVLNAWDYNCPQKRERLITIGIRKDLADKIEDMRRQLDMQPEYYNSFVCERLQERYQMMHNKLPIEPIADNDEDYFYNQKGAKVFKDIERQPMLPLYEGKNIYYVLSVGFSGNGSPLVTISENEEPVML